ncbi:hypothetical protein QVD17_01183 [Tagetes erecta]|uniref:Uncharacterized protein n=1 Tax=Tagetes erecta TaxID=13708 RepID=A0AAD8P198_TARER|nr:hypothetical protein QVD17_01183 [Tagetes erecta]
MEVLMWSFYCGGDDCKWHVNAVNVVGSEAGQGWRGCLGLLIFSSFNFWQKLISQEPSQRAAQTGNQSKMKTGFHAGG